MSFPLLVVSLLLLPSFCFSAPLTMATVLPKDGYGSLWRAVQRVVATYPKEEVLNQLRKLQRDIDNEAYAQFKKLYPNVIVAGRPQQLV